jgi:endonuclease-3
MTTGPSYERVFERLKAAVLDWGCLLRMTANDLSELISDAGLYRQKAPRLKAIADQLQSDFGRVTLEGLSGMPDDLALAYLTSLPGVGAKTAKCVLMYSLHRKVLPVDTHTARLAQRLGLVSSLSHSRVDREAPGVIAGELRYDFHVNALAHGRAVCRSLHPRCDDCVLLSLCPTGRRLRKLSSKPYQRDARIRGEASGSNRRSKSLNLADESE